MSAQSNKGQALVIILLVLAVAGTVALSLVSRSITDIAITTKEKEAARAFSAAEAGIEEALVGGPLGGEFGGATYRVESGQIGAGLTDFVWPARLGSGETISVWFVSHDASGNLVCGQSSPCFTGSQIKVCWGEEGTPADNSQTPALEVAILYLASPADIKTARVARAALDPNSARRGSNQFAPIDGSCTMAGKNFPFGKTINFSDLGIPNSVTSTQNGLQAARLRLLYNINSLHLIGLSGPSAFPSQGTLITSTGQAEESTRKIEAFRSFPDLPPIFDFGAFSGGSLTK